MPASSPDSTLPNGQDGAIPPGVAGYARKTKAKKPVDMNASKLLKHRIAQLEQDAAGEKDQEAEIGELASRVFFLGGNAAGILAGGRCR